MARPSGARRARASGRQAAVEPVELVLYISVNSRYTTTAKRNCQILLEQFDDRQVNFEVCDIGQHPERAEEDAVCYTPMLVKRRPLPRAYVLGDLSNAHPLVDLLKSCGVALKR